MACHLRHPQHRQALWCAYCHCCNTGICHNLDRQRYSAPGMEKASAPEDWFPDTATQSHSCPAVILGRDRRPSEGPAGFCVAGSLATSHVTLGFWATPGHFEQVREAGVVSNRGAPRAAPVFTSTTPGTFLPHVISELHQVTHPWVEWRGVNRRTSTTSTAGGLKLVK